MPNPEALEEVVIDLSLADTWDEARKEWFVDGLPVDLGPDYQITGNGGTCFCGQTQLRYLYTIRSYETGESLDPIGSGCIGRFGSFLKREATSARNTLNKKVAQICTDQRKRFVRELSSDVQEIDRLVVETTRALTVSGYLLQLEWTISRGHRLDIEHQCFADVVFHRFLCDNHLLLPTQFNEQDPWNDVRFLWSMRTRILHGRQMSSRQKLKLKAVFDGALSRAIGRYFTIYPRTVLVEHERSLVERQGVLLRCATLARANREELVKAAMKEYEAQLFPYRAA